MDYAPSTLLELHDTSASWRAGVAGCRVSVTLLDRVHLVVHGGDCVVIRHADPTAAHLLAVALEGEHRFRRLHARGLVDGARAAHPTLQVRRASIGSAAVAWLCRGWRAPMVESSAWSSPLHDIAGPVLHLLRASRGRHGGGVHTPVRDGAAERDAWMTWARQQRARGGALVILHDGTVDATPMSGASRTPRGGAPRASVRESATRASARTIPVASPTPTQFRLVSGRLVAAGDST
ncbi:MAG: hypothetical protein LCH84_14905 [Gemmatimonadetes bacterium]|nr:hypothetical protein [Gemmatimonadota bacterium]